MSSQKPKLLPSQEYLKECFDYDAETGILIWKERPIHHFKNATGMNIFNGTTAGNVAGTIHISGYTRIYVLNTRYLSHRLIWKMMTGNEPIGSIDHIDNDKSNNCIENLRDVTHSENMMNKKNQSNNKSGIKGIRYDTNRKKWQYSAAINRNKTSGECNSKEEAICLREEWLQNNKDVYAEAKSKNNSIFVMTFEYLKSNYYYENGHLFKINSGKKVGTMRPDKYITCQINNKAFQVHRLIYWFNSGEEPLKGDIIDHINNNPSDNRYENLRLVTRVENGYNVKSTNELRGVDYIKRNDNWLARITVNKNRIRLGTFSTKEEAISARKAAEELYHGEYARK
jgi:hypothetical protein